MTVENEEPSQPENGFCVFHELDYSGSCPQCDALSAQAASQASTMTGLSEGLKKGLGKLSKEDRQKVIKGLEATNDLVQKLKGIFGK